MAGKGVKEKKEQFDGSKLEDVNGLFIGKFSPSDLRERFYKQTINTGELIVLLNDLNWAVNYFNSRSKDDSEGKTKKEDPLTKDELLDMITLDQNCDNYILEMAILKYCHVMPKKLIDNLRLRVTNPAYFVSEKESKRPGWRTKFIGELSKSMEKIASKLGSGEIPQLLGHDISVLVNKTKFIKSFVDLKAQVAVFSDFLNEGVNPFYQESPKSEKLFSLPFLSLKMCINYGWFLKGDLIGKYALSSVKELWDEKVDRHSTSSNRSKLQKLSAAAVQFNPENEPSSFAELQTKVREEYSKMDWGRLSFGNVFDANFLIALMIRELFGEGERIIDGERRKLLPSSKAHLITLILKDPNARMSLIPSLYDSVVSFGSYQTRDSTHKTMENRYGKDLEIHLYEESLGVADQTRPIAALTFDNTKNFEEAILNSGDQRIKDNRKAMFERAPRGLKQDFYRFFTAMSHNLGGGRIWIAIKGLKGKLYAVEDGQALVKFKKDILVKLKGTLADSYYKSLVSSPKNKGEKITKSLKKKQLDYAKEKAEEMLARVRNYGEDVVNIYKQLPLLPQ